MQQLAQHWTSHNWRNVEARLNALPYATYCIECQREMERTGEIPGGGEDWSRLTDGGSSDLDVSFNDLEIDV
jgi:DnaK suppressor protein